jgi:lipoprotein-releasing system ATP-binding protein
MSDVIVSLKAVRKIFESGAERLSILRDVNLEVEKGTRVLITGESGSGKSTLLNLIGGLDSPTSGSVRVGPWDVASLPEEELTGYRSRYVGFIFQFHYLLKDFSALENVMLPAFMAGTPKKAALERARDLLAEVGLADRASHYPSQLSGGERQRVAVARALVNDPLLILADEPTGNLDPENSASVEDVLFTVVREHGTTLVMVTHDQALAARGDVRYALRTGELERA